jgi:hypothetical protein
LSSGPGAILAVITVTRREIVDHLPINIVDSKLLYELKPQDTKQEIRTDFEGMGSPDHSRNWRILRI